MNKKNRISETEIESFLKGRDTQEGIISIECGYSDDEASIIYKTSDGLKRIKREDFKPFLWAKVSGSKRLYANEKNGRQDREKLKKSLESAGIKAKSLNIYGENGDTTQRLENGYRIMFTATKKMSYTKFLSFFKNAGVDIYDGTKDFLCVSPVEQYMMRTGKRMFKGYDNYDDLLRCLFDLETEGLFPEYHRINQIGIRTNKGFEEIITIKGNNEHEKNINELKAIIKFFNIISELKPDIIAGHNVENFDWNFLIVRCKVLGSDIADVTGQKFREALYKSKKKSVLKLGGEMEYFNKTNLWGFNLLDSLHAVRRAQAIDSNMKKADLKYVTKYSKLNKDNRVYVPGDKIDKIWSDEINDYAFNDKDGKWYQIDEKHPLKDGYEIVRGSYIVDRYLKDDLYETDKVELRYNESNFLLGKLLPTSYARTCTMGTAGIWKLVMMAWSYENNLAIPDFSESKRFTGGLSRLLKVGYVDKVVKLDYNSLYPSIILTWDISPDLDISNVMLSLLNFILTEREKFKELKEKAGKTVKKLEKELESLKEDSEEWVNKKQEILFWENEKNSNDKKQLPYKIFANSFFGGFGAPNLFPWGDVICAEKTTCNGRQSLRLMIKWFTERGYTPIVGDSFTSDTPLYVKYDNGMIDILPIGEIINENEIKIDALNREYDYSNKNFKVLCRSGWEDVKYVYRHKTDKKIHNIKFNNGEIDVTSDHSLFDDNKNEIHSNDIKNGTKLEMYDKNINTLCLNDISINEAYGMGVKISMDKMINKIPIEIINSNKQIRFAFMRGYTSNMDVNVAFRTKTFKAGLNFIKNDLFNE